MMTIRRDLLMKKSIDELLKYSWYLIQKLKKNVNKPIEIKNLLNNLHSSLDFISFDISIALGQSEEDRVYFPYALYPNNFDKKIEKLSGIKTKLPEVYSLLESVQSYKCGDDWLIKLITTSNHLKHRYLDSIHEREHVKISSANAFLAEGISWSTFHDNKINGFPMADIKVGENSFLIKNRGDHNTIAEIYTLSYLSKSGIAIIPFAEKCHGAIDDLSQKIYQFIPDQN